MVIVAGHITVEPQQRESYLADCVSVVEQARRAAGCLDFAITADLIDPGRVNIFERWESQAAVETFRSSGPSDDQSAAMLSASVAEYDIAGVRSLYSGKTQHEPAARTVPRPMRSVRPGPTERRPDEREGNTIVLSGDVAAAVSEPRAKPGRELQVHGSRTLIRWLLDNNWSTSSICSPSPWSSARARGCSPTPARTQRSNWSNREPPQWGDDPDLPAHRAPAVRNGHGRHEARD